MKRLKRIICWWKGHEIEPYPDTWECMRCGGPEPLDYMTWQTGLGDRIKMALRRIWMRNRCNDCGKLLKKADHSNCIPF